MSKMLRKVIVVLTVLLFFQTARPSRKTFWSAVTCDPNTIPFLLTEAHPECDLTPPAWIVDLFTSAAFIDQKGDLYEVHLSFEENKPGQWRLAFQPFTVITNGTGSESLVTGLDGLFKIPIFANKKFFMDFEWGGGLQVTGPRSFPRAGSHFNWRPQGGLGFRYRHNNGQSAIFGIRYQHISNGGISTPNPGVDNIFLYLGFSLKF